MSTHPNNSNEAVAGGIDPELECDIGIGCLSLNGVSLASPENFADFSPLNVHSDVQKHSALEQCDDLKPSCSRQTLFDQVTDCAVPLPVNNVIDSPILGLPPKILLDILLYFTPKELQKIISTCRFFHSFCFASPSLWRTVDFQIIGYRQMGCVRLLLERICSYIHDLTLFVGDGKCFECNLLGIPEYLPKIHSLNLSFNQLDLANLDWFVDATPNLQEINLEGCKTISDKSLFVISIGWTRLKSVNLSHCELITANSIPEFAKRLSNLQTINLDGISSIDDGAVAVLCAEHQDTLRMISLDGAELTDQSICSLTMCTHLTYLNLSFCEQLSDATALHLRDIPTLEHLHLRKATDLSSEALQGLFNSNRLSNLRFLNIGECSAINDQVVDAMTKCCTQLESLCLSWCYSMTDSGLNMIVRRLRLLKMLGLCGLDLISCNYFLAIPERHCSQLEYVDLRQCHTVDDDAIKALVNRKPDLTVINYYGEVWSRETLLLEAIKRPNCADLNDIKQLLRNSQGACCMTSV